MAPRQLASGRRAGAAARRDRPPRWQDTDLAMPLSSMQPEASGPLVSGICIYYFWTVVHEVTETMKDETTGKVGGRLRSWGEDDVSQGTEPHAARSRANAGKPGFSPR